MTHADAIPDFADTVRRMRAGAATFGGPLFAFIILAAALFCTALFDLRADKIFAFPAVHQEASGEDIVALQRAAEMARGGETERVYDAAAFRAPLAEQHRGLLWLNPPHYLLFVYPFAFLSYAAVKAVWLTASLALLLIIVRMTLPSLPAGLAMLTSPATFASLLVMQAGPMTAALAAGGLMAAQKRPALSGALFALLTVKPQFGLMVPVYLVAVGAWRAIAWTVAFTAALVALSIAVFGPGVWVAFFDAAAGGAVAGHGANIHRDMVTLHQTFGKLGGGEALRAAAQFTALAICVLGVWFAARRFERDTAIGFALLATAFSAPSLWIYDWPLVAAGLFLLARSAGPWPVHFQLAAGALWIAPLISLGAGTMESSLAAPAIFAAALASAWVMLTGQVKSVRLS